MIKTLLEVAKDALGFLQGERLRWARIILDISVGPSDLVPEVEVACGEENTSRIHTIDWGGIK